MKWIFTISLFVTAFIGNAQSITSFNSNWEFIKGADTANQKWTKVQIPHTWNAEDPFDKEPGYYRGESWYRKYFTTDANDNKLFLVFEGANQETEVYVNGKKAGSHFGGYTAFNIEITDFVTRGKNLISVKVDNSHNEEVPPLKGDFNFYGGIYRDVWLYELRDVHFELSEFGDQGIFITTPTVSVQKAVVSVQANISNLSSKKQKVVVSHNLYDPNDQLISSSSERKTLQSGQNEIESTLPEVINPELWHPDSPFLYRLVSEIKSTDGLVLDTQSNSVGFRWFRFDADEGFFLNGKHLKLMGTNRHQDYQGLGNALTDDRHAADVKLIKEMGSNFFRTAHYPQDPAVINAADKLGLVVSMEIPLDHQITDSPEFLENSKRMMTEMIRQNFNHPSVFIWAYMNEMMLGRSWERNQEIIEKIGLQAVELEKLTRAEDPTRYTMIPNHGALDMYIKAGLTEIPMIVGWNLYYGWYEADGMGAGKFLDRFHELVPDKPVLITEYGAGADPRIRSLSPERFDFSIEWQNQFHQKNLIQFMERDFLAGAAIWNLADFGSEGRSDAVPKVNSKGVLDMDRSPKDSYFLYQAWLKKDPVIKIGSGDWSFRTIRVEDSREASHPVEVYSNGEEVELFLNQQSLGEVSVSNRIARWEVPFKNGNNQLEARMIHDGRYLSDYADIKVRLIEQGQVKWGEGINVNCGATFNFTDQQNDINWLPDEPYVEELWGHINGEVHRPRDVGIGSARVILNTTIDPVYQTARIAPDSYSFDVTPGQYEVVFHWAETDRNYQADQQRVFNVLVNEKPIFSNLNISEQYGFSTAVSKKTIINIDQSLLTVEFVKVKGEPMISGVQIRKLN